MIIGAHAIIYSKDAEQDRTFLRDILGLSHVDAGGGWLIFGLPPAEVAVHPSGQGGKQELYLMCNDVEAFVTSMGHNGMHCTEIEDQGWGLLTSLTLPGGGTLGVYEPRHERPEAMQPLSAARSAGKKKPGKAAPKATARKTAPKSKARKAARKPARGKLRDATKPTKKKAAKRRK